MKNLKLSLLALTCFVNYSFAQNNKPATPTGSTKKPDIPGNLIFDIGFNQWANVPEDIELNIWKSKGLNIYYMYEIELGTEKLTFNPGFGVGLDNYNFEKENTLIYKGIDTLDNKILIFSNDTFNTDRTYKKSKLSVNYIDIPIEFMYRSHKEKKKAFMFALGGKIGLLIQAHTKVKYKKDGETIKEKLHSNFFIEPFRYGVTTRIGYGGLNLFGYYSLSKMFKKDKAPEMTPLMLGFTLMI
ncbi:MAG: PorT family protein [Cytophagales bacterium]|nr:PorT family protein [Cytophagales bacterium]